jgi:hypothetical protein
MKTLLIAAILLATSLNNHIGRGIFAVAQDTPQQCEEWASAGECSLNPAYMSQHCSDACGKLAAQEKTMSEEIGEWGVGRSWYS